MNLHPDDGRLFYKLYSALMFFANERLHVLEDRRRSQGLRGPAARTEAKVRQALHAHKELIDQFIAENPAGLCPKNWRSSPVGNLP